MNKAQLIELLKHYPDDTQIRICGGYGSANLELRINEGIVLGKSKNSLYLRMEDWDYTLQNGRYDFVLISGE